MSENIEICLSYDIIMMFIEKNFFADVYNLRKAKRHNIYNIISIDCEFYVSGL